MVRKRNKKVTLSIDSSTYDEFKKYCEENAIMLSKKVEIWMSQELGRHKQDLSAAQELKHHQELLNKKKKEDKD